MAKKQDLPIQTILNSLTELDDDLKRALEAGRLLTQVQELQIRLRAIRQDAVVNLNEDGWSFEVIAGYLHITKGRAHQIAIGQNPSKGNKKKQKRN